MAETTSDPFAAAAAMTSERFSGGYSWPECPRWHDGALHLTDMYNHRLLRLDGNGEPTVLVDGSRRESSNGTEVVFGGFGWLPDGRIVVNSMHERLVLVWDGTELTEHADLSGLATGPIAMPLAHWNAPSSSSERALPSGSTTSSGEGRGSSPRNISKPSCVM